MFSLLLPLIYLAFISLGLPDSLLGAAWPSMCPAFGVPVSYAGLLSLIISGGTVAASLLSDRLTKRFGTGRVTALSVALSAFALLGFSVSGSFWLLCVLALPYGLGAGSVDASLNNYVALHYASRHMSWLHCMWGVGTIVGPLIMGALLSDGHVWSLGYRCIGLIQTVIAQILFLSLPLWEKTGGVPEETAAAGRAPLSLRKTAAIPGVKAAMLSFFCYCAYEQTAILWGSSFLVGTAGLGAERAAFYAGFFCVGITLGRALCGFATYKLSDTALIRSGHAAIALGAGLMLLPLGVWNRLGGLLLMGLGCAPIYPSMIHATPGHFGAEHSQAVIGLEMASAYVGVTLMPPLFGLLAQHVSVSLMPVFILALLACGTASQERLLSNP